MLLLPGNISSISLKILDPDKDFVIINFTSFRPNDARELLNYVIYYKEA